MSNINQRFVVSGSATQRESARVGSVTKDVRDLKAKGGISAGALTGSMLASGTITNVQIAGATILGSNIAAGTIAGSNIASATITGSNIASGTITGSNIAAATIANSNIVAGTITGASIAAATITGSNIAGTTITAANIVAATITTTQIAAATITGANIAATTITGSNIAATTITASNLNIASLSAITAAAGTLTSGTLTALTHQTSATTSVARTLFDSTGIYVTDSSNTKIIGFDQTNGIQLIAPSSAGVVNRIRWRQSFSGTASGDILMQWNTPANKMQIVAYQGTAAVVGAHLEFQGDSGTDANNYIFARAWDATHTNNYDRYLILANQRSSYLQVGGAGVRNSTVGNTTSAFSAAASGAAITVTVPGATGSCHAVANSSVVGTTKIVCIITDNANGTVTITPYTMDGTSITGTATIHYVAWGV